MPSYSFIPLIASLPFWRRGSALVFALALQLTGCDNEPVSRHVPPRPVMTTEVSAGNHGGQTLMTGEILPHEETIIGFRTDGRMVKRLTDVGQSVVAGQVLAELDDTDLCNQYRSAQAVVQEAGASVRLAEINLRRMTLLAPQGAVARVQLDEARTNRDTATAKLQSAQADLSSATDRLGYARLVSPVTGVVTTVSAGPGQVVTTGQEILRVAQSGARDAVFSVPGALADTLKQQQTLTLRMADNPSVSVTGTLRDISPQADTQTRTWRVRYDLENAPAVMAMGATVTGSLPMGGSDVFQVPASALTRKEQKPAVFVVDTDKTRLRLTPVDIAAYMTDSVLIRKGLTAGEQVVTAGVSQLRDGENVLTEDQK